MTTIEINATSQDQRDAAYFAELDRQVDAIAAHTGLSRDEALSAQEDALMGNLKPVSWQEAIDLVPAED